MLNKYGNGTTTASHGANTQIHYYDRAGINASNAQNVYAQWASRKHMPTKRGKTYKISRWQHIYERDLNSTDFAKHGFLTSRDIADVTDSLSNATLPEGAGRQNFLTFQKITLETSFNRYGEMIDYTDEVELFSEDYIQTRYREELGYQANRRNEDLIQLDMLGTNCLMYTGVATSKATMGAGLVADASLDDEYRVGYDFIRKCVKKLVRNRAKKNTHMVVGSTKIDTRTINRAYYAIIGNEVKYDLENTTKGTGHVEEFAYIPAYKYGDASNLAENEVGCLHEVRFIESESAVIYRGQGADVPDNYAGTLSYTGEIGKDAKFDVFPILFPTEDSFATVGLKGQSKVVFRSQNPSKVELDNPYGTRGFFSYNFWYAGIILQEERLLKGLVLASA
ncbi:MAG: N4-gp56 family major capsid protein [Pasteurella sp.]|nr:N4-gp56 family major capsid protein [Pasteurella sp.]